MDRGIDRVSLGIAAYDGVVRVDIRKETLALENGLYVSFFLGYLDALLHVFLDAGVGAEITVYQFLGLRTRDAQTLGEPEDGDAVDDTEVGGFRLPAHIAGYFFYRDSVDLGGCGGVDIRSALESLDHMRVTAQVGHDTKLDLGVVGREEEAIRIVRDKCLTDLTAQIVPYRNVLQVRIGRAEASGRCYRLVERGMYLSGLRIDQLG